MKRICVFCGSSPGARPEYSEAARNLGRVLAQRGIGLVYGGGRVGMMGELAAAALAERGEVIGVIPKALFEREVAFDEITDLRVVDSMHERKALMADLSDAFVALPGGLGTLEEFLEIVTWAQLGIHEKPCGLINVNGYFDGLTRFVDHAIEEEFIQKEYRSIILADETSEGLLEQFAQYRPPTLDKAQWALRMLGRRIR